MNRAIITFVRKPELGKVKTRIAAAVGDYEALRIYRELLRHTRRILDQVEATRYIYYTQIPPDADRWSSAKYNSRTQVEGDLGSKLQAAFAECLDIHDEVLVIGSDCATLTPQQIEDAFNALSISDVAIGPTLDGGYYLLGLKRSTPSLFENIHWSTDTVLEETIAKVTALNQTYTLLERLSDIDYIEDWQQYGWD